MTSTILRSVVTTIVNAIAGALPDDPLSSRGRAFLYRPLSTHFGHTPTIKGGCRINGFGLRAGDRVFINRSCYFDLSAAITIGDDVVVGHHTLFVTASHELGDSHRRCGPVITAPIVVEDGAWIGCRSVILPGVRIGRGSVIGAGSIVTRDVPPDTIVRGMPAEAIVARSLALL